VTNPCPFCEIIAGRAPAEIVRRSDDALAIVPLNPVTPGHLLVIPTVHVADFAEDSEVSAKVMLRVAELCEGPEAYNVITSKGTGATQSVFHLHLHVIPRTEGDGLALPWSGGRGMSR